MSGVRMPINKTVVLALTMTSLILVSFCMAPSILAASSTQILSEEQAMIPPTLNIEIPGISFANSVKIQNGYANIPYLAQYLSGVYRYLIGISIVVAAIVVVWGGFLYLVGSSIDNIKAGKQKITNALIGLMLLLGIYTILNTINPSTTSLSSIKVQTVRSDWFEYGSGNEDAPSVLSGAGVQARSNYKLTYAPEPTASGKAEIVGDVIEPAPGKAKFATNLNIPANCPGRTETRGGAEKVNIKTSGGKGINYPTDRLKIPLTQDVLKKYLDHQSKTGVPAGAVIANMLTETWSNCPIMNLFDNPKSCGGQAATLNFGGIGCSQTKDIKDEKICPNVGYGQPPIKPECFKDAKLKATCTPDHPEGCPESCKNKKTSCDDVRPHNDAVGPACHQACLLGKKTPIYPNGGPSTDYNCGNKERCYPQPSYTTLRVDGVIMSFPSLQCSRIFKDANDFLESEEGFLSRCLPYNDSVYKFAYCIGASKYSGAPEKGALLAEIIQRNCLCGSSDSTGCKRDLAFEDKLSRAIIAQKNLFKVPEGQVTTLLQESTGGALVPRQFNDLTPPTDFNPE